MDFYTNVQSYGNSILYRGIMDGKRVRQRIDYTPSLYLPSKKETQYKSLDGIFLDRKEFDDIRSAREFFKKYDGIPGAPKIYGNTRFEYAFIADQHTEMVDWDLDKIKIANIDIEVGSENGFPDPYQANEPITAIGLKELGGHMIVWGCGDYDNSKDETNVGVKVTYIKCRDEWTLCNEFIKYWTENTPDVITGWRSEEHTSELQSH